MDTTYPVITQTYTPEETSRISGSREVLPQVSYFKTIELYIPQTISYLAIPIVFKQGALITSAFSHRRYNPQGTEVNDFEMRSYQSENSNTITYASMATYANSSTITNTANPTFKRDSFLQIYTKRLAGVFVEAQMLFSLTGKGSSFFVLVTDSNGGGVMGIPKLAADPATGSGRMYYNTATGKFRVCDGGGWKDL